MAQQNTPVAKVIEGFTKDSTDWYTAWIKGLCPFNRMFIVQHDIKDDTDGDVRGDEDWI